MRSPLHIKMPLHMLKLQTKVLKSWPHKYSMEIL